MSALYTVLERADISISPETVRLRDQTFDLSEISKIKGSFRYKLFNYHGCLITAIYTSFFVLSITTCFGFTPINPEFDLAPPLAGVALFVLSFIAFILFLYRVVKRRPHHMIAIDSDGTSHHYVVPKFEHIAALRKARRKAAD